MENSKKQTIDGNTAAAMASYHFTEVAAIYPITPSSPMAEAVDEWACMKDENMFGSPVKVVEMQSEAGAAGTMHGSLQAGALTTTYTSSQGLLLMIPNLYKIAGELLPAVLHVSARSLASNALSIFGDHQDVMSIRQTGVALLASGNVQECMDLGCLSHLAAVKARIPFVHFFDGFRTSHEIQKIDVIEREELEKIYDWEAVRSFKDRALNPDHPVLRGTTQNPDIFFQEREAVNPFYRELPGIVEFYMSRMEEITGRSYKLFDYYGDPEAEEIFISMGSSCEVIKETVDYLAKNGEKSGLVQVRLYRPFSVGHFLAAVPKTVKTVTVLDRTKEPGALMEPLCLDVCAAFTGVREAPRIVGGRYGLASKDFTPADVLSIWKNMKLSDPKNHFTVGINDDVTFLSLPREEKEVNTIPCGTVSCKFWGFGSDGTVGANKSAVKIIGSHTEQFVQAYFAYDSKKSGGLTVSHLRFGAQPIRSSYLVHNADYIACHNQSYVNQYDLLEGIKVGGIFLLNCVWSKEEALRYLPEKMKKEIIEKNIKFYVINAVDIAEKIGLGKRINMIMQSAFFWLTKIIPYERAADFLKEEVRNNYGRQGQEVIDKNIAAIEAVKEYLKQVSLDDIREHNIVENKEWKIGDEDLKKFICNIMEPMNRQKGDGIPVSAFSGIEDGTFPTGTTQFEKRGIALKVPVWKPEACIQCNRCSLFCPHSVLRPTLLGEEDFSEAPEHIRQKAQPAKGYPGKYFYMGISEMDCMGCGNCVQVCPAKEKALVMTDLEESKRDCDEMEYLRQIAENGQVDRAHAGIKESQFLPVYFEFSGACAGCGETPYAKLITQLYGDRMMISNSAGCATVWGGSAPAVPYRKDEKGHGPAWGFSLFEDNAEYGFGMYIGYRAVREEIRRKVKTLLGELNILQNPNHKIKALIEAACNWEDQFGNGQDTRKYADELIRCLSECREVQRASEILERKDFLIKRSNWIFGGDGWAYDIGYGGLDHVLSSGVDINVMVFDTEVYSNTGGQASKSTPKAAVAKFSAAGKQVKKKDLGMMAIQYGNVYVAQIALGADPVQSIRAIKEAESYPGASLIIGYAPCINHGIKGGMGKTGLQQKKAVDAGYWNLYRYDPRRREEGKVAFTLDSGEPKGDFEEFLMSEVRFSSLFQKNPELARELVDQAQADARQRYEKYQALGMDSLGRYQ